MRASFDEAKFLLGESSDVRKGTKDHPITDNANCDTGETLASKNSLCFTCCGGSLASGQAVPACFSLAAEGLKAEWVSVDGPRAGVVDPSTGELACELALPTCTANTKGGTTGVCHHFIEHNIGIAFGPIESRPEHPSKPGVKAKPVILGDGVDLHWTDLVLLACDRIDCDMQLRVPHTQHTGHRVRMMLTSQR